MAERPRTALITGVAGGLGRAMAAQLRAEGWRVLGTDRPGPELEALAEMEIWPADLTDRAARDASLSAMVAAAPKIDLAIYNAGVTLIGPFEEASEEAHRAVFEVNYFAAVAAARACLAPVRRARGAHLAISSVAGFAPLIRRTAYAASKHALEGFFASLRSEEAAHGVAVSIAAPSFVATNLGAPERRADGVSRPGSAPDGVDYMDAEAAARIILAGAAKRRPFTPVGRVARLAWRLQRLSPALMRRAMERGVRGAP